MAANRFSVLTAARATQNAPEVAKLTEIPKPVMKPATKRASALKQPEQSEKEVLRRGRPHGKRTNPDYRQVTAYISVDNYKRTKIKLLENDNKQEFSELVDQLLAKWLEEQ